jgi:hypothetical protein
MMSNTLWNDNHALIMNLIIYINHNKKGFYVSNKKNYYNYYY